MRLKNTIRDSDTVARFGGDEFIILFENISDKKDAAIMTDSLTNALNLEFRIMDEKIGVNCSVGVAIFPDDGDTADTLLNAADKAMYLNK